MARSAQVVVATALLLGETSLAMAKIRGVVGGHGNSHRPGINETTSRPTAADPYYRLSERYYGYSDPYRGLYDFDALPPYIPGYTYGHVKPGGWQ
jgi:hypothetical protein